MRAPYDAAALLEWAGEALEGHAIEKSGAVILADQNFKALVRRPFAGAMINEVGFGSYDAKGKEGVYFTLKVVGTFQPPVPASDPVAPAPESAEGWRSDAFRVEMGGLPCSRISRVEPFSVTRTAAGPRPSHLVVYVPPEDAAAFQAWQAAPRATVDGAIESLGSAGQVFTTLRLSAIEMVGVAADPGASPPRVRVELAPKAARLEVK